MQLTHEGLLGAAGRRTWYGISGELTPDDVPLVVLHGGPGYPHDYLQPLARLARPERPVIFYDQLGCGRSDRPDQSDLWTIDFFLDELERVIEHLGVTRCDLLGQSWGGSLAAEFAARRPVQLRKLVLHSPNLDSRKWMADVGSLKDALDPEVAETMTTHEANGTTESDEYSQAYERFAEQFVCRAKPYPELMRRSDEGMGRQVYETMWGPSEAFATGLLKEWSVIDRMSAIAVPTLFISGQFDEATPSHIQLGYEQVPHASWEIIPDASHTAHIEAPEHYFPAVGAFLDSET